MKKKKLVSFPEKLEDLIADIKKELCLTSDSEVFVRAVVLLHRKLFKNER